MSPEMRAEYIYDQFGGLIGKTVAAVRPLTPDECYALAWNYDTQLAWIIEFTDGTAAIPACDPEGNGRGHLLLSDAPFCLQE